MNVASRMESSGVPGRIQVTPTVVDACSPAEFSFEKRGSVSVKGIGEMETWFLTERKISDKELRGLRDDLRKPNVDFQSIRSDLFQSDILEILQTPDQLPMETKAGERREHQLPPPPITNRWLDHQSSTSYLPESFL